MTTGKRSLTSPRALASIGAFSGLFSVMMGAVGAHALKGRISDHALSVFHTASEYEILHALALVAVALCMRSFPEASQKNLQIAGGGFLSGTVFFSLALYLYALTGGAFFAMVAPVGGISLMVGWLCLGMAALSS